MDLKRYRRENDLSMAAMARKLNVSTSVVCNYERGRRFPTPGILARIEKETQNQVTANDILANYLGKKK